MNGHYMSQTQLQQQQQHHHHHHHHHHHGHSLQQQHQHQQQVGLPVNARANKLVADYKQIILELRAQNFDVIRFATYRTASKLRFIQKKLNLHLIDLWNVIETFRDNNFHTMDIFSEIEMSKVELCVQNMYLQLNKRLAHNQHINVESQSQLLMAWLLNLYDKNRLSKIRVISLKVALTTMCAGKLIDKLKYIFTQISDTQKNVLVLPKFELYLKDLLTLPKSVFEEPSFGYNEGTSKTCFDLTAQLRLEDFLSVSLSDVGPPCFIWLNIFHRFTIVQNISHPVTCSACERTHFNGFRYKCQKCRKYQLCQDCFWRGRISHSHQLTHQMKEYTSYKSAAKQFSNSLRRSFFCKPNKGAQQAFLPNRNLSSQPTPTTPSKSLAPPPTAATPLLSTPPPANYTSDYTVNTATHQQYNQNSPHNNCHTNGHQQLTTANSCNIQITANGVDHTSNNSVNKLSPNSIIKPKKITQQIPPSNLDEGYLNSESTQIAEKTFDMRHLVPPSPPTPDMNAAIHRQQQLQQQQRLMQQQQQQQLNSIVQARMKQQQQQQQQHQSPLINTNETGANNQINTCSNLFMNYMLANNSPSGATNGTTTATMTADEEHGLIANYCSRLNNFYAKNPHLCVSPDTTPPPGSSNNNTLSMHHSNSAYASVTNIKKSSPATVKQSSTLYLNNSHQRSTSPDNLSNNNGSRTASLSRHLWSSGRAKPTNLYNTLSSSDQRHSNKNGTTTNGIFDSHTNMLSAVHRQSKRVLLLSNGDETATTSSSHDSPVAAENVGGATAVSGGGGSGFFSNRSRSECNFMTNGHHQSNKPVVGNGKLEEMSPSSIRASKTLEEKILKEKKEIVMKLERQNREIIKEIKRLRLKQAAAGSATNADLSQPKPAFLNLKETINGCGGDSSGDGVDSPKIAGATIIDPLVISLNEQQQTPHKRGGYNKLKSSAVMSSLAAQAGTSTTLSQQPQINGSPLIAELQTLKHRKGQLESRMHMLESSKDELLGQLETLLKQSQSNKQAQRTAKAKEATVSFLSSPRSLTINSTQKYNSLINNNTNINGQALISTNYQGGSDISNSPLNAINVTVPGLSDMYTGYNSNNYSNTTSQNVSPNNMINKSSFNSINNNMVPQVSAAMAMQMPHQSRSMTTTNGSAQRSWSTPSNTTAPQFELHPTRLVNGTMQQQYNNNQSQQPMMTVMSAQQSEFIAAKNRVLGGPSASLVPSTNSSLLSINALAAFGPGSAGGSVNGGSAGDLRNLRNDLLIAADSVTSAMQSLVKELHSETGENNNNNNNNHNMNSSCYSTDDEDAAEYTMDPVRQREMMLMLTSQTHHNHFQLQQQHHQHFNNVPPQQGPPPPPSHMFTSLSANTTPLLYRKTPQSGAINTSQLGYANNGSLSTTNTPLHNRYNSNQMAGGNNGLIMPVTSEEQQKNMSKVNLIKQIARTFKDMNNNSEYDDVVSDLEAELLNCGEQLDEPTLPASQQQQQSDEVTKMVMNMNLSLNGRNVYDELSRNGQKQLQQNQVHNDEEIEDIIYENYLLSDSFINEMNQQNADAAAQATKHEQLLKEEVEGSKNGKNVKSVSNNNSISEQQGGQSPAAAVVPNFESQQQADSWRRELEQVLIAESNDITTHFNFSSKGQNSSGDHAEDEQQIAEDDRQQSIDDFLTAQGYNDQNSELRFEQARNSVSNVVEQLLQDGEEEEADFDELLSRALNNENKNSNQNDNDENDDEFSLL